MMPWATPISLLPSVNVFTPMVMQYPLSLVTSVALPVLNQSQYTMFLGHYL